MTAANVPESFSIPDIWDIELLREMLLQPQLQIYRRVEDLEIHNETAYRWTHTVQYDFSRDGSSEGSASERSCVLVSLGLFEKERIPDLEVHDETGCLLPLLSGQERLNALFAAAMSRSLKEWDKIILDNVEAGISDDSKNRCFVILARFINDTQDVLDSPENEAIRLLEDLYRYLALLSSIEQGTPDPAVESQLAESQIDALRTFASDPTIATLVTAIVQDSELRKSLFELARSTHVLAQLPLDDRLHRILKISHTATINYETHEVHPSVPNNLSPSKWISKSAHWAESVHTGNAEALDSSATDSAIPPSSCQSVELESADDKLIDDEPTHEKTLTPERDRGIVKRAVESISRWARPPLARITLWVLDSLLPSLAAPLVRFLSALGLIPQVLELQPGNVEHCRSYYALIDAPEGTNIVRCYWSALASSESTQVPIASAKTALHWSASEGPNLGAEKLAYVEIQFSRRDPKLLAVFCGGAALLSVAVGHYSYRFFLPTNSNSASLVSIIVALPGLLSALLAQRSAPFSLWLTRWPRMLLTTVGVFSLLEALLIAGPFDLSSELSSVAGVAAMLEGFLFVTLAWIGYGKRWHTIREHGFFRSRNSRVCTSSVRVAQYKQRRAGMIALVLAIGLGFVLGGFTLA